MTDAEILLANVTGEDRPGITARLTALLATDGSELLDIGQATIHDRVSFTMLIRLHQGSQAVRTLLLEAHSLGMEVRFAPVPHEAYERWVGAQGKPRWIVSLMSRRMDAAAISRVAAILSLSGLNIDNIVRLSGRAPLEAQAESRASCVEFSVRGEPAAQLGDAFLDVASTLGVDIAVERDDAFRMARRLLVCGESVLLGGDPLDALIKAAGAVEADRALPARPVGPARTGARVALLAGLPLERAQQVIAQLPLAPGAAVLRDTLKDLGIEMAVLSTGISLVATDIARRLGISMVHATQIGVEQGVITGRIDRAIEAEDKVRAMQQLAADGAWQPAQVIAIGSSAHDLPLLAAAGLGVTRCSALPLSELPYLLGVHQAHQRS